MFLLESREFRKGYFESNITPSTHCSMFKCLHQTMAASKKFSCQGVEVKEAIHQHKRVNAATCVRKNSENIARPKPQYSKHNLKTIFRLEKKEKTKNIQTEMEKLYNIYEVNGLIIVNLIHLELQNMLSWRKNMYETARN